MKYIYLSTHYNIYETFLYLCLYLYIIVTEFRLTSQQENAHLLGKLQKKYPLARRRGGSRGNAIQKASLWKKSLQLFQYRFDREKMNFFQGIKCSTQYKNPQSWTVKITGFSGRHVTSRK